MEHEKRLEHLSNWQRSGLSMSDYCRKNSLPVSTLRTWKSKYLPSKELWKEGRIKTESKNFSQVAEEASLEIEIPINKEFKITIRYYS
ncbi:MAG: hypothetical protein H7A25_03940 [Leptospiraceae bacterium]|nr:hypothetical protein [Leptospiraceae bacterium]